MICELAISTQMTSESLTHMSGQIKIETRKFINMKRIMGKIDK